ncbi:MAG: hypothetical protein QOI76_188 [Frankiales bacterium]|jgi:hypothetical protein|nr:hypothetical protein [Frankiales bacterium]
MSYWSLRRTAERAAAGHELARTGDDTLAPARIRLPDWTPVAPEAHPATVTSGPRTLRQRAADLEKALWTVPSPDPADLDPTWPGGVRVRARSTW